MANVGASFPLEEACELLRSKKHTDFILECKGHEFSVHRMILYQKSPFFRAALDHEFNGKSEGRMTIGETTPEALATTIIYCIMPTRMLSGTNTVLIDVANATYAHGKLIIDASCLREHGIHDGNGGGTSNTGDGESQEYQYLM